MCFLTAEQRNAGLFSGFLSFALFQRMSEPRRKRRTCDVRGVGFSPAGDLLLRWTNPLTIRHHLSSSRPRATEHADASGSP